MNKFDEIISLGSYCNTSLYLKNIGKKRETYVFDWVGTIDASVFKKLIDTNFENFFEYDDFIYFRDGLSFGMFNKRNNIAYIHDKFDKQHIVETKTKYIRRAERFMQLMKSNKKILFIRIQARQNHELKKVSEYEDIVEFSKYLKSTTNITFAIILIQAEEFLPENTCDIDNKIIRIKILNNDNDLLYVMKSNKSFIEAWLNKI